MVTQALATADIDGNKDLSGLNTAFNKFINNAEKFGWKNPKTAKDYLTKNQKLINSVLGDGAYLAQNISTEMNNAEKQNRLINYDQAKSAVLAKQGIKERKMESFYHSLLENN